MEPKQLTYDALVELVENWSNWSGELPPYDFTGITTIFAACLRNFGKHMDEVAWDSWEGRLSKAELDVLYALVARLREVEAAGLIER